MEERTSGFILRVRPLTDTSLIVHWLTGAQGRVATVAKGARRPKSPYAGKLDLFFFGEFSFQRSRRSDLHTLREVVLREAHEFLRENLPYLQQAAYCSGLIEKNTETDTPLPEYFDLFAGLLHLLPLQPPTALAVLAFETKFLTLSGLSPSEGAEPLSGGARQFLEKLDTLPWCDLPRLRPTPAQTAELKRFLCGRLLDGGQRTPAGRDSAYI
jgi:DNA repair protein RecO (recombination protein O)